MMQAIQNLRGEQGLQIIENGSWAATGSGDIAACAEALTDVTVTAITQTKLVGSNTRVGDTYQAGRYIWGDISAITVTGKLALYFGRDQD